MSVSLDLFGGSLCQNHLFCLEGVCVNITSLGFIISICLQTEDDAREKDKELNHVLERMMQYEQVIFFFFSTLWFLDFIILVDLVNSKSILLCAICGIIMLVISVEHIHKCCIWNQIK